MNVSSWLKEAPIARLDAELILAHSLGVERTFLHAHPDFVIPGSKALKLAQALRRRVQSEPLAYITGEKDFYGRIFKVGPDVLIPRPETEALIEIAKNLSPSKIIDVGTGSGCIAISLKKELPDAQIVATDISEKALKIAKENAQIHQADITFYYSNLLENVKDSDFDLIIANLPYVDKNWDWLGPELQYEPAQALYANDGGLEQIKRLITQAPNYLKPNGYLLLEADLSQHQDIISFAGQNGDFIHIDATDATTLALTFQLP